MKITSAAQIRKEMKVTAVTNATEASAVMRRYNIERVFREGATALFTITDYPNPFHAREADQGSDQEKDMIKLENWLLSSGLSSFDRRDDLVPE